MLQSRHGSCEAKTVMLVSRYGSAGTTGRAADAALSFSSGLTTGSSAVWLNERGGGGGGAHGPPSRRSPSRSSAATSPMRLRKACESGWPVERRVSYEPTSSSGGVDSECSALSQLGKTEHAIGSSPVSAAACAARQTAASCVCTQSICACGQPLARSTARAPNRSGMYVTGQSSDQAATCCSVEPCDAGTSRMYGASCRSATALSVASTSTRSNGGGGSTVWMMIDTRVAAASVWARGRSTHRRAA